MMAEKKEPEIPVSIIDKARQREVTKTSGKDPPMTMREVIELKQQEMAQKIASNMFSNTDEEGRSKSTDIDVWLDKMMKYQTMKSMFSSKLIFFPTQIPLWHRTIPRKCVYTLSPP